MPYAVFPPHAVPLIAVVGRRNQRVGEIPQRALVVGQAIFGGRQADAGHGLAPDPGMHVVRNERRSHPVEITVQHATTEQHRPRQRYAMPARAPGSPAREYRRSRTRIHRRAGSCDGLQAGGATATAAALAAAGHGLGRIIGIAFDANHRKDDDGGRFRLHPDRSAATRGTSPFGKPDDCSHRTIPPPGRRTLPRYRLTQRHRRPARLTLR